MLTSCSFSTSADRPLTCSLYTTSSCQKPCFMICPWCRVTLLKKLLAAGLWWKCCFCDFAPRSGMITSGNIRAWWTSPNSLKRRRTTTCRCPRKRWSRWTLNTGPSTVSLEASCFTADWILLFLFNIWHIFYHSVMMWSFLAASVVAFTHFLSSPWPPRTLLALGCRVVQVNQNAENALKKIKLTKK